MATKKGASRSKAPAPKRDKTPIADVIRAAIEGWLADGSTQHELAKEAGLPRSTIGRFLDGSRDLKLASVEALAGPLKLVLRQADRRPAAKPRPAK